MSLIKAFSLLIGTTAATITGNYRMVVTTTQHCVELLDEAGEKLPCGESSLEDTFGAPIPGMVNGAITFQQDVIAARDGTVTVQNSPLRPYVLSMTTQNETHTQEMQMYNGKASVVGETLSSSPLPSRKTKASLEEEGYEFKGIQEVSGRQCYRYVKYVGFNEDYNGVTYGHYFASGVVPDTWTLYTDAKTDAWVEMIASNSYHPGVVYQSSKFSQQIPLPADITLETAVAAAYSTYDALPAEQVESGLSLASVNDKPDAPRGTKIGAMLHESSESRDFYSENRYVDWRPTKRVRGTTGFKGIKYFTIDQTSTAVEYFMASKTRMLSAFDFSLPKECKTTDATCLTLKLEFPEGAVLSLALGFNFNDPTNDRSAFLQLSVVVHHTFAETEMDLKAGGCATLWQYGISQVKLALTLCMTGEVSKHSDTFKLAISATIKIEAKLWKFTVVPYITGVISAEVKGKNDIQLFGALETGIDVFYKSAGVMAGLDINAHTTQDSGKIWMFESGAYFTAYVDTALYSHKWEGRHTLWKAGPVQF